MSPDDPAVTDVLQRAMVARIATLSRNRRPNINPLYFVCVDGNIHLGTSDRTLAAFNIEANPDVAILFNVEGDPDDRRVLRIRGRATVRTDPGLERSYVRRAIRKYFMSWRGLTNTLRNARLVPVMHRYHASGEKGRACVVDVIPEYAEWLTAPPRAVSSTGQNER